MSDPVRCLGVVTKVVRVPLSVDGPSSNPAKCEGYGLLRDEDGQEIYFTHLAVEGCPFTDVQSGQRVEYRLENGPLKRASRVRPLT